MAALIYFDELKQLFSHCPNAGDIPKDFHVDEKTWKGMLVDLGKNAKIDMLPFSDILELSASDVKDLILQKQVLLMRECRVAIDPPLTSGNRTFPKSFYDVQHMTPRDMSPVDLPRVLLKEGDRIYCPSEQKDQACSECDVVKVENERVFARPKHLKDFAMKEYPLSRVALIKNAAEEGLWFPVQTLVVAWRDNQHNVTPFGYTEQYYDGIVLEGPVQWNSYRYLILYKTGEVSYIRPDFVCRAAKQDNDNLHTFTMSIPDSCGTAKTFAVDFFKYWPKRNYLMADKGQTLSCNYLGKQATCTVEQIDCSLFRVSFPTIGENKNEWIYRGSSRFECVAEYKFRKKSSENTDNAPSRPHRIKCSANTVIETTWTENGPEDSFGNVLPNDDTFCFPKFEKKSKPTARKSTIPGFREVSVKKRTKSPPPERSKEEKQGVVDTIKFSDKRHGRPDTRPPIFVEHECSATCFQQEREILENVPNFKDLSYFSIPIRCGWTRIPNVDTGGKGMLYISPCGIKFYNFQNLDLYLRSRGSETSLMSDMFVFEKDVDVTRCYKTLDSMVQFPSISSKMLRYPITVVNKIDQEVYDDFVYTDDSELSEKIVSNGSDPDFLTSCDCVGSCNENCFCRRLTAVSAGVSPSKSKFGYQYYRLLNKVTTGIYECNDNCKCKCNEKPCLNRVVQRPSTARLQLFKTADKGWGVQSLDDLPRGQYICTYAGEVLTSSEADEKGREQGDEYLYDLDFIDMAIREKNGQIEIDDKSDSSSQYV